MGNGSIQGILVDLGELKKTPNLALWGRFVRPNGTLSPHMKLLEVPINWNPATIEETSLVCDTYLTFE